MTNEIVDLLLKKECDYLKSKGIDIKGMSEEEIHNEFDKIVKELEDES